jgi:hypothetical protein
MYVYTYMHFHVHKNTYIHTYIHANIHMHTPAPKFPVEAITLSLSLENNSPFLVPVAVKASFLLAIH